MDKREFNIKVEQIKKRVNEEDYETAMKIADAIDWRRVRNTNLLTMVAQIYEKNGVYDEAKNILLLAFERAPIGKRLLYKLTDLALKENNIEEAEDYYREFCDLAPEDSRQHLLRYMILKAKGAPAEQLAHSLEQYTAEELDEKWMYELAFLYHQMGWGENCVRLCDKIMLMFGIGKYVDKAMELKQLYAPLNNYQRDLAENKDKYEAKLRAVERAYSGNGPVIGDPVREEEGYADEMQAAPEEDGYAGEPMIEEEEPETPDYESEEDRVYQNGREQAAYQTAAAEAEYEAAKAAYQADPRGIYDEAPRMYDSEELGDETEVLPAEEETQDPPLYDAPEYTAEEEPAVPVPDRENAPYIDQVLEVKMREEQEQENLAREMAKMPQEEDSQEDSLARTKVLKDIREVLPGMTEQEGQDPAEELPEEDEAPRVQKVVPEPETEEPEKAVLQEEEPEEEPGAVVNHLMIEARTPEKGLELALSALKQIHRELGSKHPVAKISGSKLNSRGIMAVAPKLAGRDLVVEEAGDLSRGVLDELNEFMAQDQGGTIVVLIDNPRQMEELHRQNPELASRFECIGTGDEPDLESVEAALREQAEKEAAIAREENETAQPEEPEEPEEEYDEDEWEDQADDDGYYEEEPDAEDEEEQEQDEEEMDIDEFAQYACAYAADIDCSITGKSMLALYERIEIMEEEGIPLTRKNAEDLIEEAADKADRPPLGKRIANLFSSKYDKNGLLILKEEHFID